MSTKAQAAETLSLPTTIDLGSSSSSSDHRGNVGGPRVLNSWKDVANYLGRGVRTVQRYEAQFGLPVRRPAGKGRSSVMAFADELDAWLGHATKKHDSEIRRTLLVLSCPRAGEFGARVVLEVATLNVHAGMEEILEAASRCDIDSVVLESPVGDDEAAEICRRLGERHPSKQVFAVSSQPGTNDGFSDSKYLMDCRAATQLLRALSGTLAKPQAA